MWTLTYLTFTCWLCVCILHFAAAVAVALCIYFFIFFLPPFVFACWLLFAFTPPAAFCGPCGLPVITQALPRPCLCNFIIMIFISTCSFYFLSNFSVYFWLLHCCCCVPRTLKCALAFTIANCIGTEGKLRSLRSGRGSNATPNPSKSFITFLGSLANNLISLIVQQHSS